MEAVRLAPVDFDMDRINHTLRDAQPTDVIAWARDTFGANLSASTSFGATSAVVLHMLKQVSPDTPVICVDTGYLFEETYKFAQDLIERLDLDVRFYAPMVSSARQEALYGKLWEQGEDGVQRYLQLNKVEPMQRALREMNVDAWIAGLRADQTEHRAGLRKVDIQDGRIKIHPILAWSSQDLDDYIARHDLPYHPLVEQGYRSIGDHHSTLPTTADMDPREGRMLGRKKECGIHLPLTAEQDQSLKSSGL